MAVVEEELAELGRFILEMEAAARDAYLDGLTADEIDLVEAAITAAELEGADWRANPATLAHHLTRGQYRLWAYTRLLGEKFADAVEGRSLRQIWLLPRRYGKSLMASQWGPTWALDRYPHLKLLLASYGDDLAVENAVGVRDKLLLYQRDLSTKLRRDRRQAGRFVTTQGGGILARGINSAIVGFGADGAVFDDPYKNWQEAHSPARRDLVLNAFRSVVYGTLESDRAFVIIPMTCWHEDDISQHLLRMAADETNEQWELVRLPEIAETPNLNDPKWWLRLPDPLGREPGQVIEPERFSLPAVKAKHKGIGSSYFVAAMYQQRPAPEEGGEVKRGWFRTEIVMPVRYDQAISSWDMKLKDNETGDYVVGQAWGRTGKDMWLFDQLRGQWNQATTGNALALLIVRHPQIRTHYVENAGYGPEVIKALREPHEGYTVSDDIAGQLGMTEDEREAVNKLRRRGIPGIIPVPPKGSKPVRMRAVSGYIEAGDVHIPDVQVPGASWVGVYLDEMAAFPNGGHDDQVDATSQALSKLTQGKATARAATGQVPKTPVNTRGGGTMGVTAPPAQGRTRGTATVRSAARAVIPRGVPRSGR